MHKNKKIVVGGVIIFLIAFFIGVQTYADILAKKKADKTITEVADYADVSYKKVRVDLVALDTHIKGVTISPVGKKEVVKIDDIIIYDVDDQNKVPSRLHVVLEGVNMKVHEEHFGDFAKDIKEMGYDEINSTFELKFKYDQDKKELYLENLSQETNKAGLLYFNLHLTNIDLNTDNILSLIFSFPKILIHSAELRYEDDSLMSRLQTLVAKKQNKDVDEVLDEITKELDRKISEEQEKFTKDVLKALKKFIKKPEKIVITVSPKKPIPIRRLQKMKPSDFPEALNIKVKT